MKEENIIHPLFSMKKYIRRHFFLWLLGLILPSLSGILTNLYFADQLQNYSSQLLAPNPSFRHIAGTLFLAAIFLLLFSNIEDIAKYLFSLFIVSAEIELKQDFYTALNQTSLKNLQKFHLGELATLYHTDIVQSTSLISHDIRGIVYPIFGFSYLVAAFASDLRIGIGLLILGSAIIFLNFLFLRKKIAIQKEILQAKELFTLNCSHAIQGKISIRQYSAQKMILQKIDLAALTLFKKERQAVYLQSLKILISDGLANLCIYLLTPLACIFAVNGAIQLPVVLFIHQICRYFIMYIQNAAHTFLNYSTHALSYKRIHPILTLPNETNPYSQNFTVSFPTDPAISFEKVSIFYENRLVLKNATFLIRPGEIVGLIGESGSGKSSLYKALLQITDYQGTISVGGIDCKEIPLSLLREHISVSPEHNNLFFTSVYENIQYGNLNSTKEDIFSVMQQAAISDISLFLHRNAGENGISLSGGQRQKISLARAFLKNAPILILDEPTAALDTKSEEKVLTAILEQKKERKCILLITHKPSTLQIADRILKIENQTITELK